jgi:hypothetical protein
MFVNEIMVLALDAGARRLAGVLPGTVGVGSSLTGRGLRGKCGTIWMRGGMFSSMLPLPLLPLVAVWALRQRFRHPAIIPEGDIFRAAHQIVKATVEQLTVFPFYDTQITCIEDDAKAYHRLQKNDFGLPPEIAEQVKVRCAEIFPFYDTQITCIEDDARAYIKPQRPPRKGFRARYLPRRQIAPKPLCTPSGRCGSDCVT